MRTLITTTTLTHLWTSKPRTVFLPVMLTTAQLESGIGNHLYDATAERFEQHLFDQRQTSKWTEWLIYLGFSSIMGTPEEKNLFTSFGPFQIMGFNFRKSFDDIMTRHARACQGLDLDDYILFQMEIYDRFMDNLYSQNSLRDAFRRYNGSGPAAHAYADKAMKIYDTLTPDITESLR